MVIFESPGRGYLVVHISLVRDLVYMTEQTDHPLLFVFFPVISLNAAAIWFASLESSRLLTTSFIPSFFNQRAPVAICSLVHLDVNLGHYGEKMQRNFG